LDKAVIRPDAALELDKIVQVLQDNPEISIELGSHTDSRASASYNLKLSQRRADSAVKYIIDHGISANRIKAKGYGESQLINGCTDGVDCSEEAHQENRRTEFKITDLND
jgi:outer membrane protein OmpA-like peptidoglycan-associated protein